MNVGTDLKVNVHFEPISELTMDDLEFTCKFFTNSEINSITCKKADMIRVDESNYVAVICTKRIGHGDLKLRVVAEIPDPEVEIHDGIRYEEVQITTGIHISK